MKERGARMNDKRRLKRASVPSYYCRLKKQKAPPPSLSLTLSLSLSLSCMRACKKLYLFTSDAMRRASRCLVYIHDGRVYNLVGARSNLQRDQGDALYNSIRTEIEIARTRYKIHE